MKTSEPDSFVTAAQYLRKSEHQRYSIDNQIAAIEEYAALKGFRVVKTYVDAGRSGLTFESRHELKRLITDVQSGAAPFKVILVYDVSRWGDFRISTKPPITSSSASGRAYEFTIVPGSLATTAPAGSPPDSAGTPRMNGFGRSSKNHRTTELSTTHGPRLTRRP